MILVTGGTGYLGKSVIKSLRKKKVDGIRCIVRPGVTRADFEKQLEGIDTADIEMVPASFLDQAALADALKGVRRVIHLAASKTGSASSQVANTVVGSDRLFAVCADHGLDRFVLCSSFGVIHAADVARGNIIDESVPMEKHPEKRDPYSFTKSYQEEIAWEYYKNSKLPLTVIRPGVIFGPPAEILSGRIGLPLFGVFLHLGGPNEIPLTYKDNCADAIVQAALTDGVAGEAFCIADDDLPTSAELLKRYKKEVKKIRSVRIPYHLLLFLSYLNQYYTRVTNGHLPDVFTPYKVKSMWQGHRFSNQKARQMLDWSPEIGMEEALKKTYDYLRTAG